MRVLRSKLLLLLLAAAHVTIKTDSVVRIHQTHRLGRLDPVGLGRPDAARTGRFEIPIYLQHLLGDFTAVLKVKALHIGHRLVDAADAAGIAHGALGTIAWPQMRAMDAANTDLANDQLLGSLGMASRDILVGGGKDFAHLASNVALAIRQ